MTELSYHWSAGKFLDSNDVGSRLIAAIWLVLYVALIAMAITPGAFGMTAITAALSM